MTTTKTTTKERTINMFNTPAAKTRAVTSVATLAVLFAGVSGLEAQANEARLTQAIVEATAKAVAQEQAAAAVVANAQQAAADKAAAQAEAKAAAALKQSTVNTGSTSTGTSTSSKAPAATSTAPATPAPTVVTPPAPVNPPTNGTSSGSGG